MHHFALIVNVPRGPSSRATGAKLDWVFVTNSWWPCCPTNLRWRQPWVRVPVWRRRGRWCFRGASFWQARSTQLQCRWRRKPHSWAGKKVSFKAYFTCRDGVVSSLKNGKKFSQSQATLRNLIAQKWLQISIIFFLPVKIWHIKAHLLLVSCEYLFLVFEWEHFEQKLGLYSLQDLYLFRCFSIFWTNGPIWETLVTN